MTKAILAILIVGVVALHPAQLQSIQRVPFVLQEHHVAPATKTSPARDVFTVRHGKSVFTVRAEVGSDLRELPDLGQQIRECVKDGKVVQQPQPTSDRCMARVGDFVVYMPTPNGPGSSNFLDFEIVEEHLEKP